MKREILLAGAGWMSAGIICILGWLVERGVRNPTGLLLTGTLVIIIGALLLLLNKSLEKTMEKIKARQSRRAQGRA